MFLQTFQCLLQGFAKETLSTAGNSSGSSGKINYEVATGLEKQDSKIRLASLRSVMGKVCLQIFLNLNILGEDRNNICLTALENYFKPQRNVVRERCVFNSCEQNPGESVDSYVVRLQKFASSFEFGSLTDELIRDRLVIGLINKAIDIVRSNEITCKQLESMKSNTNDPPTKEEVNLVGKGKGRDSKKNLSGKSKLGKNVSSKKKTTGNARFKFCGKQQLHSKRKD